MKKSILRTACACLLMLMALAVTLGFFTAPKEKETVYLWQSVCFAAEQTVEISDAEGNPIQTILPVGGIARSKLLPTGSYFVRSGESSAEISIGRERISVRSGGWTDGKTVYLTDEPVVSFRVEFASDARFYTFYLCGMEDVHRQTVRGYAGKTGVCEFFGLPYGTYELYLGEEKLMNVQLDGEFSTVVASLDISR